MDSKIILTIIFFLMIISYIGFMIYEIIRIEKLNIKFRKNLKIGDKTDRGIITKIDNDNITVEIIINRSMVINPEYKSRL